MHEDYQIQKYHIAFASKYLYRNLLFSEMEDDYLLTVRSISL